MQLKIYCQSCGSPNFYVSNKPNFCGSCGNSFSGKAPKAIAKKSKPIIKEEVEEEIIEESEEIPNLTGLKINIQETGQRKGLKFEEIMGTGPMGFSRPAGNYSIEQFKKDAGSGKRIEIGGDDVGENE